MHGDKIITDGQDLAIDDQVRVFLKKEILFSTINKKVHNENGIDF
jgi:hypothetical protein